MVQAEKKKKEDRFAQRSLDELVGNIKKKHGENAIVIGADPTPIQRITTGSLSLDMMYGGGIPAGQWNEYVGHESSGKTTLVYKLIEANQKLDPDYTVFWIASERFVEAYAVACGVDLSRVIRFPTQKMEVAYDELIKFAASQVVDLVVIDSLPMLTPAGEYEGETADSLPGLQARLNNKFFRVSGMAMNEGSLIADGHRLTTGIVINQWREKIGVQHGDPRTTPGGQGKDYAYFTKTDLRRADWLQTSVKAPRMGLEIAARTVKNKSFAPQRTGLVHYYFDGPLKGHFDVGLDLAVTAAEVGILKQGGSWFSFGDQKWQGMEAAGRAMLEDLGLRAEVRAATLSVLHPDTIVPVEQIEVVPKKRAPRKTLALKK